MAHAGGRPKTIDVDDVIKELDKYIENTNDPLIPEFCASYRDKGISKSYLYELSEKNEELANSIKRLVTKQEAAIVRNTVEGKNNPIFSIFRLKQKQFGWSDKMEVEQTNINIDPATLSPEDRANRLAELKAKILED